MTLTATEFLRRFFLHVLPKGFVRIRHFGFLANRFHYTLLPLCQQLASDTIETSPQPRHGVVATTWHCPRCGHAMLVLTRFTAAELRARWDPFDTS